MPEVIIGCGGDSLGRCRSTELISCELAQAFAEYNYGGRKRETEIIKELGRTMASRQVVLFPLPMEGRMNPMLQLGSMLHSKGFSVSIICTEIKSPNPADYPMFTFHFISIGLCEAESSFQNGTAFFTAINKRCEQPFKECLNSMVMDNGSPTTTFLIVDGFLHFARAVVHSLNMRTFVLLPFGVSCFRMFLEYKGTQWHLSIPEKDLDIVVPEFSPLRMKDVPKMNLQDPKQVDELMLSINTEIRKSDGMVFNSFMELESQDIAKLEKDLSIPIFPCGPLKMVDPQPQASLKHDKKCMSWLDQQQPNSVVYVNLGSVVSLTKSEFHELALGIATSNHKFLWVVRPGLVRDSTGLELLPDEIMDAVEKGLIVKWAPQKEVLAHPAVGGFLTHAGWNSIMESISARVPMICMPFFAEQLANARYVSEAWRIGLYFEEMMDRSNIQKAIRKLMDDKECNEIRENITCLKNKVERTLEFGGSSYKCLENLVEYIKS